jgi:hypothetical protein
MDELACAPERTLMIGDTTHDLQLAANAGTDARARELRRARPGVFSAHAPLFVAHSTRRTARLAAGPWMSLTRWAPNGCARRATWPSAARPGSGTCWSTAAGACLRAALRGPRGGLPEPLCPCAHRDGLAARRVPRCRPALDPVLDPWRRLRARRRPLRRRPLRPRPADADCGEERDGRCIGILPATSGRWPSTIVARALGDPDEPPRRCPERVDPDRRPLAEPAAAPQPAATGGCDRVGCRGGALAGARRCLERAGARTAAPAAHRAALAGLLPPGLAGPGGGGGLGLFSPSVARPTSGGRTRRWSRCVARSPPTPRPVPSCWSPR